MQRLADYSQYVLYVVAGSVILLGNGLIIGAVLLRRHLRRRKELLIIVGLAFADFGYGLAQVISGGRRLYLVVQNGQGATVRAWDCMLEASTPIWFAAYYLQGAMMLLLSVDRYLAIAHFAWWRAANHRYPLTIFSVISAHTVGILVTGYASSYRMPRVKQVNALCHAWWAVPQWYRYYTAVFSAALGYLSVIIYFLAARQCRRPLSEHYSTRTRITQLEKQKRLTLTVGLVAMTTLCFYCTSYTGILLCLIFVESPMRFAKFVSYLSLLNSVNAMVNIGIYCGKLPEIRQAVLQLFCCCLPCATDLPRRSRSGESVSAMRSTTTRRDNSRFLELPAGSKSVMMEMSSSPAHCSTPHQKISRGCVSADENLTSL